MGLENNRTKEGDLTRNSAYTSQINRRREHITEGLIIFRPKD